MYVFFLVLGLYIIWRSHHLQGAYTKISLKHAAFSGCTITRLKVFIATKHVAAK
jgi:hypothetical protein